MSGVDFFMMFNGGSYSNLEALTWQTDGRDACERKSQHTLA